MNKASDVGIKYVKVDFNKQYKKNPRRKKQGQRCHQSSYGKNWILQGKWWSKGIFCSSWEAKLKFLDDKLEGKALGHIKVMMTVHGKESQFD